LWRASSSMWCATSEDIGTPKRDSNWPLPRAQAWPELLVLIALYGLLRAYIRAKYDETVRAWAIRKVKQIRDWLLRRKTQKIAPSGIMSTRGMLNLCQQPPDEPQARFIPELRFKRYWLTNL
jgi:hypothetical protein